MNYKINFKLWALCFALTITLFGCKKTSESADKRNNNQSITVTMPSETTDVITRASDAVAEVAIKRAYVIIYAKDAVSGAMPKFTTNIDPKTITDAVDINSKTLTFFKDNSIAAGDVVYVIFNKELANLHIAQNKLIETLKLTSSGVGTGEFANGLIEVTEGLPMYGKGEWVNDGTTISIKRGVAKVQLKLVYSTGTNHVAGKFGTGYTTSNTTFKLYQLSDIGFIDGSFAATTGSEATSTANDGDITHRSALIADNYTGANYIFAYPYAQRTIGTSPTSLKNNNKPNAKRLAMVMKNTFEGKSTYHRLDICEPSNKIYYDILNNHHYTVKLREVGVDGYTSATTALNSLPSNIKYDIIVEDEGDVVVTNGQYVLNIDTKEDLFEIAGAPTTVKLANVNRVTSIDADITSETTFSANISSGLSVSTGSKALTFALRDIPTTLGRTVKNVNVAVSGAEDGMGIAKFRYKATLGNIYYESNAITLNSKLSTIKAAVSGETLTFKVSSTSTAWSAVSDSPSWARIVKNSAGFDVIISAYNYAYRIAKIKISDPKGESITVTITQDLKLPIFADRNVGVDWALSTVDELCDPANSRGNSSMTEIPKKFFTWKESLTVCDNWNYGGHTWRLPTNEEFNLLVRNGKLQLYGPHDAEKLVQADGSTVYFPRSAFSYDPARKTGNYWSSTPYNSSNAHLLYLHNSSGKSTTTYGINYGLSVRCCR